MITGEDSFRRPGASGKRPQISHEVYLDHMARARRASKALSMARRLCLAPLSISTEPSLGNLLCPEHIRHGTDRCLQRPVAGLGLSCECLVKNYVYRSVFRGSIHPAFGASVLSKQSKGHVISRFHSHRQARPSDALSLGSYWIAGNLRYWDRRGQVLWLVLGRAIIAMACVNIA